jgi:cation/acetate symporter
MNSSSRHTIGFFAGLLAAVGLVVFVLVVALVEEMGLPDSLTFYVVAGGALVAAAAFGLSAPTMRLPEFYVAGRAVGSFHGGVAVAAGVAFLAFFGVSGLDFTAGGDGTVLLLGPTLAVLIAGLLLAPEFRRSGALTLPEYFDLKLAAPVTRIIALVALAAVVGPLLAAAVMAFAHLASYFAEVRYDTAVFVAVVAILATTILGGARSMVRATFVQFLILFVAYLLPAILLAARETGIPAPAFLVGQTLHALGAEIATPGANAPAVARSAAQNLQYLGLVVWLALGLAALPQVLMPAATLEDARQTRRATAWAVIACLLLFAVAPGYALFARSVDIGIFALPEITGMPFVMVAMLVAGGLSAMTVVAAGLALTLASTLGLDLYLRTIEPRAPQGRQLLVVRLLLIGLALLAAWAAIAWRDHAMAFASASISLAAAGFLPALIALGWWRKATAAGVAVGVAAGTLVAAGFIVAARFYGTDITGALHFARWPNLEMAAGFLGAPVGAVLLVGVSLLTQPRRARVTLAPEDADVLIEEEEATLAFSPPEPQPAASLAEAAETAATPAETPALARLRQTFIRSRLTRR